MASVKLSAFMTDLKGKIGGTVFQGNKTGVSAKNKQAGLRSASMYAGGKLTKGDAGRYLTLFGVLAKAWRSLTFAQIQTWVNGAVNFPFKNKFGDLYTGSGFQVWMYLNGNLENSNSNRILNCPSPEGVGNPTALTITYDPIAGVGIDPQVPLSANEKAIIYATTNQSAGRGFEAGRAKKIQINDGSLGAPFMVSDAYATIFGEVPQVGRTYYFAIEYINTNTGEKSLMLAAPFTVA